MSDFNGSTARTFGAEKIKIFIFDYTHKCDWMCIKLSEFRSWKVNLGKCVIAYVPTKISS